MPIRLPSETDRLPVKGVWEAMVQVESEAIGEITYDEDTSKMFVRFAQGGWYAYFALTRHSWMRNRTDASSTNISATIFRSAEAANPFDLIHLVHAHRLCA